VIFPGLFACCENKFATVAGVRSAEGWRIRFRRSFTLVERVEWENLCMIFDLNPVRPGEDKVSWALEESGCYSTNSLYLRLSHGAAITHYKEVWRTRVPRRSRSFCGN
jgi:hypothetical protein